MRVCTLSTKDGNPNYCEEHGTYHNGHYAEYAIDPGEKGQRFRELWDRQKFERRAPALPPLHQRAANYIASLAEHTANGSKIVPLEVRQARAAICHPCEHRNTIHNACSLCGCGLNPDNALGDKLSWEVSKCPAGKWDRYTPPPGHQDRHLLFHIWPRRTHVGTWQRNLDQLKMRWPMFTGRRIIAIVTSHDSHPAQAVKEYMHGYDCEFYEAENDPRLREVATFDHLFGSIENAPGYTFYAQAKGVTKPIDPGVTIHAWTTAMYETLLDYWPLVEESLKTYPVVGSFKKSIAGNPGAFEGSSSQWHYSGSFCWFRNSELWRRNWRAIERVWFGIESYPSMIFRDEEAGVIFHKSNRQFDLYTQEGWGEIEAKLRGWRIKNEAHRRLAP